MIVVHIESLLMGELEIIGGKQMKEHCNEYRV
jgi:hypothetical protein